GSGGIFKFKWSNGLPSTEDQDSLTVGTYEVTITDPNNGCTATKTYTVKEPSKISVNFSVIDESCVTGNDGEIAAIINGGVSPYKFDWSNGDTTQLISSLNAGLYYLTVSDANKCSIKDSVRVESSAPFLLSSSVIDVSCNGGADGAIDLTVNGTGAAPTFAWNNGLPNTEDQSNLSAGTYLVTVTDPSDGCIETASITINE